MWRQASCSICPLENGTTWRDRAVSIAHHRSPTRIDPYFVFGSVHDEHRVPNVLDFPHIIAKDPAVRNAASNTRGVFGQMDAEKEPTNIVAHRTMQRTLRPFPTHTRTHIQQDLPHAHLSSIPLVLFGNSTRAPPVQCVSGRMHRAPQLCRTCERADENDPLDALAGRQIDLRRTTMCSETTPAQRHSPKPKPMVKTRRKVERKELHVRANAAPHSQKGCCRETSRRAGCAVGDTGEKASAHCVCFCIKCTRTHTPEVFRSSTWNP